MRRRHIALALVLFAALPAISAHAQNAEQDFRASVLGKQLYLRDFNAGVKIEGTWTNGSLVLHPPAVRAFAAFIAQSVKLKDNYVEIAGNSRVVLRKDTELEVSPAATPVLIHIAFEGTADTVLPQLVASLFFASRDDAAAVIPEDLKTLIPANDRCCKAPPKPDLSACDCAELSTYGCRQAAVSVSMSGMKPPKVLKSVELKFSDAARQAHYSGSVQLSLEISALGHAEDLWLVRPAGMGLDENAVTAVSQYVFSPAACHGKPVPIRLSLDVNFQTF